MKERTNWRKRPGGYRMHAVLRKRPEHIVAVKRKCAAARETYFALQRLATIDRVLALRPGGFLFTPIYT